MKLTVLCDNTTRIDGYYLGEPGASYYLEDGDTRILFDTGYSDVYLRNAEKMGIDLGNITALALSHGHDDHTGGLVHFPVTQRVPLYAHPEVFAPKRIEGKYIGSPLTKEELEKSFELKLTKDPVWLTDKLVYLGEIPRVNAYEARYAIGERLTEDGWVPDMLPDDTAMAYKGNEGLWIITGCSHSGINNITEYAKRVCGDERICGIVGGFHLLQMSSQTHRTVEWLGDIRPKYLRPCHCTCFHARAAIHNAVPVQETCVGDTVVIE
jgi:7,8-dihydropterin-6-yl-methyl-4-(beta-D-ribofuranosyl)aminobenzene 5'-phosphate synthase